MLQTQIISDEQMQKGSCVEMVSIFNDLIYRLYLIKIKIQIGMEDQERKKLWEKQQVGLSSLWNKHDTMLGHFVKEFQQRVKDIHQFCNTQIHGEDITYMLKYLQIPPQQQTKNQLHKCSQFLSQYSIFKKDSYQLKKYKRFISDEDEDEQQVQSSKITKYKNQYKHKYFVQTLQREVQTTPCTMDFKQNLHLQHPQIKQNSNGIYNSKVFSTYETPSPFTSNNKSQNLVSSPFRKGDKPSLPSTDRQRHPTLANYHHLSLISFDTLLYVLKMMEYLLPVGFLVGEIQNIKICRLYMKEHGFSQSIQVDWIEKTLRKVVKKMKMFKNQLRKDFSTSKFIDLSEKLSIKVN